MLCFGPQGASATVVVLPPLFEEANRCRAMIVAMCRKLAAGGAGVALPDLPGQGESPLSTDQVTLADWHEAVDAVVADCSPGRGVHIVSVRGSAILDQHDRAASVWRLSPLAGAKVIGDLRRAELIGSTGSTGAVDAGDPGDPGDPAIFVGNALNRQLCADLETIDEVGEPIVRCRTVRLKGDPLPADAAFAGTPLWRRAEPGNDGALATVLGQDIIDWIGVCGG